MTETVPADPYTLSVICRFSIGPPSEGGMPARNHLMSCLDWLDWLANRKLPNDLFNAVLRLWRSMFALLWPGPYGRRFAMAGPLLAWRAGRGWLPVTTSWTWPLRRAHRTHAPPAPRACPLRLPALLS